MTGAVASHFIGGDRTRSNQAHVSFEYVEELRKLVQAELPQEAPDSGHAGIVGQFKFSAALGCGLCTALDKVLDVGFVQRRIRVLNHGAELVELEILN